MFIKKILNIRSGIGGNGLISFNKINNKIIPNGGNGGDGGDVFFCCNNNVKIFNKELYSAQNGEHGKPKNKRGKKGKNLLLKFPIGSYIEINNYKIYIVNNNYFVKVLNGGLGGVGNFYFKKCFNSKIATKGGIGKVILCTFIYKFFVKSCILNIEYYKKNILFNIKKNFISKIYLIFINLNKIKLFFKILKFYLYFLYLKNLKNNSYWLIVIFNNKKFNKKILIKIKSFLLPFFFVSKLTHLGLKKIFHYLIIWKNS